MRFGLLAEVTLQNFDPPWFWVVVTLGSLALLALTYLDIYRRSGRRLAWTLFIVRSLGLLALLVALVKPAWRHVVRETEPAEVAVILDDSQSMSLPPAGARAAHATRYQQARWWLTESPAGRALAAGFRVRVFDVAGRELEGGTLAPEPNAEQTDLVRAMRSVGSRLRGRNAAGVLLVSDGCDTTGRRNYMALQEYPLPVFALGFPSARGAAQASVDLAVRSVDAPARTLVHNAVQVNVLVRKDGGGALEVPVYIERAGTPLVTERVALARGSTEKLVTLTLTPADPGDFVMSVRLGSPKNERTTANNTGLFKLRVDAQPIRVLYIEGVLRPEYKFLRQRLADDPDVDLITFVRAASPDQASVAGVLAGSELVTAERLKKINVVLLGDFESRMLDPAAYRALRDWVEAGGGLMILGGYRNLSADGLVRTPLADLLPIETAAGGIEQIDEPFRFRLTPDGRRHPALAVTGDMSRDAALWEGLPELQGIVAVKGAKPGATVLARHPLRDPLSAGGEGYVVLASQAFGKGAVVVFTADTTWRWSRLTRLTGRPDTLYVRFWSQMVRWLAHRDVVSERTALTVSTASASYQRGQRVTVTVRRNPAVMLPGEEGGETSLALTVAAPDGRTAPLVPAADLADPNGWTATYFPDRGGRFEVAARLLRAAGEGTADVATQRTEFLVEGSKIELEDPTPNVAVMGQIARLTGGTYAELDDEKATGDLVAALPAAPRVVRKTRTTQMWNSPALFMVFLVLICAEWVVRRRNHLV
ncbi:MAG TPA: glutamine amidotransferase [Phycisphaerae bacterium]|nr:glutamine amidotransferase [Phycisphaerae bacterium]